MSGIHKLLPGGSARLCTEVVHQVLEVTVPIQKQYPGQCLQHHPLALGTIQLSSVRPRLLTEHTGGRDAQVTHGKFEENGHGEPVLEPEL